MNKQSIAAVSRWLALAYHWLSEDSTASPATEHQEKESTLISGHEGVPPHFENKWYSTKQILSGERGSEIANKTISQNVGWYQKDSTTKPTATNAPPMRVIFLSTHNSARSQMAEGLLRAYGGKAYQVFSAGTDPTAVHPLAIKAMWDVRIDISNHRAKRIEEFTAEPLMDLAVTVCDDAAQTCPCFANARWQIHWHFPDPSELTGSKEERFAAFCHIRNSIAAKISLFPVQNLSHLSQQLLPEAMDRKPHADARRPHADARRSRADARNPHADARNPHADARSAATARQM